MRSRLQSERHALGAKDKSKVLSDQQFEALLAKIVTDAVFSWKKYRPPRPPRGRSYVLDEQLPVKCIPFSEVIETLADGTRLDLLQIDAEGADGQILSLFPFYRVKPAIVHWEIKNMTRLEQETTLDLLCSHQYLISRSGEEDMLAVHREKS